MSVVLTTTHESQPRLDNKGQVRWPPQTKTTHSSRGPCALFTTRKMVRSTGEMKWKVWRCNWWRLSFVYLIVSEYILQVSGLFSRPAPSRIGPSPALPSWFFVIPPRSVRPRDPPWPREKSRQPCSNHVLIIKDRPLEMGSVPSCSGYDPIWYIRMYDLSTWKSARYPLGKTGRLFPKSDPP